MQKFKKLAAAAVLISLAGLTTSAFADSNVALNKSVTLNGVFGTDGWGGALGAASSVTDGTFFPETTQWDSGSVWWNSSSQGAGANSVVINLGGQYSLSSFAVQADDNDTYLVEYNNNGTWQSAWNVGAVPSWGLVTRTSGILPTIVTDQLRFTATGGDGYYSVSEIQAIGSAVPEPESYAMMLAGLGFLGFMARRKAAKKASV